MNFAPHSPIWHPFTQHALRPSLPRVLRAEGAIQASDFAPGLGQTLERLRRGNLVNQMEVYINKRGLTWALAYDVTVPDFLK